MPADPDHSAISAGYAYRNRSAAVVAASEVPASTANAGTTRPERRSCRLLNARCLRILNRLNVAVSSCPSQMTADASLDPDSPNGPIHTHWRRMPMLAGGEQEVNSLGV